MTNEVLVNYECEAFHERSALYGVENPPTNAFYFVIMVRNKFRQYYFPYGSNHWNFYNIIHESPYFYNVINESPHFSKRVVVKFEAIAEDEGAAFNPIYVALGEANIPAGVHLQMIAMIHSKAARLAQLGNSENRTVPILVDICQVFIRVIQNPFEPDSYDDDDDESEEDEDVEQMMQLSMDDDTSFPMTESSIGALGKVTVDENGGECCICWEEMAAETEVTLLPCNHIFHGGCIANWLRLRNVCPLCRFRIPPTN